MVSRILIAAAGTLFGSVTAMAAPPACPSPDVLGTGRTLAIGGAPRVGLKTYPQTLDLADQEVVLTFDDGPAPATTPEVLDALKAHCVKATFFLIGRNAAAHPALVRREVAEGHSVGHHTWDHPPLTLRSLGEADAMADIEHGWAADDKAAYGSAANAPRVPFFRFPGFGDTPALLDRLTARHVAVFGADVWASDWVPMTPEVQFDRLMERLRLAGRGIILLHDIKTQTAEMLPSFLLALKAEGFRVVHVVPGGAETPTCPALPRRVGHPKPSARSPISCRKRVPSPIGQPRFPPRLRDPSTAFRSAAGSNSGLIHRPSKFHVDQVNTP